MSGLEILRVVADANRKAVVDDWFDEVVDVEGSTREGVPVELWRALR